MQCDTCKQESPIVLRVVVAKDYNRTLAKPIFNCQDCFDKKQKARQVRDSTPKIDGKR